MTIFPLARLRHFVALAALVAPTCALNAQAPASIQQETKKGEFTSLSSCANGICHGADAPRADATGQPERIRGDEFTSRLLDPHNRATAVLRNELSREIVNAIAPGKKAWQLQECLACHGSDTQSVRQGFVDLEDGISCQSCHGPAGGWGNRHFEDGWTHQDSVAAGLRDLRNPGVRAQTCLRCHQGDAKQQVDHRLLAAGHPLLTFELDNYSSVGEVRHWLPDAQRAARDGRAATHGLRAWGVGQAVAFRESLELLASRAESGALWPEFAELSCSSCHHPVGDGAWRRQPGYKFRNGLPPYSAAKWAILRELLAATAPDRLPDLEKRVETLGQLVGSFGGRGEVAAQAKSLAKDLEPLDRQLAGLDWPAARIRSVLEALVKQGDYLAADPQVARQTALTLHSLAIELAQQDRRVLRTPLIKTIDQLFDVAEAPNYDRGRFASLLAGLK